MPDWAIPVIALGVIVSIQTTIVILAILSHGDPAILAKLIAIEQAILTLGGAIKPGQVDPPNDSTNHV